MFIVTNRQVHEQKRGFNKFGHIPNEHGPHELRIVEVTKRGSKWIVDVLPDIIDNKMKKEVGITDPADHFCSEYVSRKIRDSVRRSKRHILFYVHGFNNDMEDVAEQAENLRRIYKMEVISFSWPAKGGGAISGTLSYKKDKKVAQLSVGALDRTIEKINKFINQFNKEAVDDITKRACRDFPDNPSLRNAEIASLSEAHCPIRVSALFHSMGNYLFKHAVQSSVFDTDSAVFDNIVMAAADTNNEDHAEWVDKINARKRIYIAINENDYALRASRMKLGDAQKARLGHYIRMLDAKRPFYIDFTDLKSVGNSHSYFTEAKDNAAIKRFFSKAFCGDSAEQELWYHASENIYRFWS